ncbi:hypothetical protein [Bacillus massilinigeriensis]|uniref:hypothetical protein n=1 Tax=Bacillus massilionigeriensis TaxID=1805475 RepID=UPI00096B63B1|nr:hypothetical protein [Bacillus massilionigeriensis]
MRKNIWLLLAIISVFFITACGQSDNAKDKRESKAPTEEKKEIESTTASDINKSESESRDSTKENPSEKEDTLKEDEPAEGSDNKITYQENGQTVEQKATSKTKDGLSIKILPNYSLDQEEPGKYVVIDDKTGDMLRIEKSSDGSMNEITEELKMRALAVSNEITRKDTVGTDLDGGVHYKAVNGSDVVNIIYLPMTQSILTIFEKKANENIEPFVAMAKTIKWN